MASGLARLRYRTEVIKRVLGHVAKATDVTSVVYNWHDYDTEAWRRSRSGRLTSPTAAVARAAGSAPCGSHGAGQDADRPGRTRLAAASAFSRGEQAPGGKDEDRAARKTYLTHAAAFEPMLPGDPFGDPMNAPKKYAVSRTLARPTWSRARRPHPASQALLVSPQPDAGDAVNARDDQAR